MEDQAPKSKLDAVVKTLATYCSILCESRHLLPTELLLKLKRAIDSEIDLRTHAATRNRDGVEL